MSLLAANLRTVGAQPIDLNTNSMWRRSNGGPTIDEFGCESTIINLRDTVVNRNWSFYMGMWSSFAFIWGLYDVCVCVLHKYWNICKVLVNLRIWIWNMQHLFNLKETYFIHFHLKIFFFGRRKRQFNKGASIEALCNLHMHSSIGGSSHPMGREPICRVRSLLLNRWILIFPRIFSSYENVRRLDLAKKERPKNGSKKGFD